MTIYGFIRTSRDQEPGHPGSDPQVQRRQVVEAISMGTQVIRSIDGPELAALMIETGTGFGTETIFAVKKLDTNYFTEF